MDKDGEITSLCLTQFVGGFDHRMRRSFDFCLGVEAAEGETQRAGGIAGADPHGLKDMRGMQRAGVAGGSGGAGDARLIQQDEHPCGIGLRQTERAGGVQAVRRAAVQMHFRQRGVEQVLKAVAQRFDAGLGAVVKMLGGEFGGFAEGDDAGHVLRAATPLAFLTPAHEQGRKTGALADVERANCLLYTSRCV